MEQEGQAQEQPEKSAIEMAQEAALSMIQKEEGIQPQAQAQPEGDAEQEGEETAAESDDDTPQPRKHKLTVKAEDGSDQELEVDDDELKKGFMLEKSYRQKTTQLAREREALTVEKAKAIADARAEYDAKLATAEKVIQDTLAPELKSVDWAKLAAENPAEYVLRFQQKEAIQSKLNEIQAQRKTIAEQQKQEMQAAVRKQAEKAVETLQSKIPQWNDALYGNILKSAVENYGYAPQEVGQITDPKAIEVLHDAMQYRALKAKPLVDKRVPAQPKPVLKAGSGDTPNTKGDGFKKALDKLSKSGKRDDAVAAMTEYINRQGAGY